MHICASQHRALKQIPGAFRRIPVLQDKTPRGFLQLDQCEAGGTSRPVEGNRASRKASSILVLVPEGATVGRQAAGWHREHGVPVQRRKMHQWIKNTTKGRMKSIRRKRRTLLLGESVQNSKTQQTDQNTQPHTSKQHPSCVVSPPGERDAPSS